MATCPRCSRPRHRREGAYFVCVARAVGEILLASVHRPKVATELVSTVQELLASAGTRLPLVVVLGAHGTRLLPVQVAHPAAVDMAMQLLDAGYEEDRQDDGTLSLRAIDATSGAARDLGVRLPVGTGQGLGLSARWDRRHGRMLLLARTSTAGAVGNAASGGPLQAWLVSFVSSASTAGVAH